MKNQPIKALFIDVGGVLLSNGWDHALRQKTASRFKIDLEEMSRRHELLFDAFERGKFTFDYYLTHTIFYEKRNFSIEEVKKFIFDAVVPYQEMIDYVKQLKKQTTLKIAIVTNEGKELAADRFKRFNFHEFVDFFIISSLVQMRKPDPDFYQLAINCSQFHPEQILYLDDRQLFVELAKGLKLQAYQHVNIDKTATFIDGLLGLKAR